LKWKDLPHENAIIIASEPAASSVSGAAADEQSEPAREIAEEYRKTAAEKLWLLDWSDVNPDERGSLLKT
jgi:hypothetical protein